jgi:hypothetical protein
VQLDSDQQRDKTPRSISVKLAVAGDSDRDRAKLPIYQYDTCQLRTKIGQVAAASARILDKYVISVFEHSSRESKSRGLQKLRSYDEDLNAVMDV